jgi:broad specificity phosphatase PhoE
MAKSVELYRHTAADGDVLTPEGVRDALEVGSGLAEGYDVAISSGAQRATQTLACILAGSGVKVEGGVVVEARFRSDVEDRWKDAYQAAGAGDIASFRKADPELVENESELLGQALRETFDRLPEGGRALVVGHSPMQEAAVYGLTGEAVEPLSKGAGILVTEGEDGSYKVEPLG